MRLTDDERMRDEREEELRERDRQREPRARWQLDAVQPEDPPRHRADQLRYRWRPSCGCVAPWRDVAAMERGGRP